MTDTWTYPEDVPAPIVERLHQWLDAHEDNRPTRSEHAIVDIIRAFWPPKQETLTEALVNLAATMTGEEYEYLDGLTDRAKKLQEDLNDAFIANARLAAEVAQKHSWNATIEAQVKTLPRERDEAASLARDLGQERESIAFELDREKLTSRHY